MAQVMAESIEKIQGFYKISNHCKEPSGVG